LSDSEEIVLEQYDPAKTYSNQKKFDCGHKTINRFVAGNLKKQIRQNLSQCYVLLDTSDKDRFIGFYTLSSFSIKASELEALSAGSLPNRIPCCRLIMLGVDNDYKSKGYGKQLMKSVILKAVDAAEKIGIYGLYLDADPGAYSFYEDLGFIPLKKRKDPIPTPMFLHIDTMRAATP